MYGINNAGPSAVKYLSSEFSCFLFSVKGLALRNIDSLMTKECVKIFRTLRCVPIDYCRHNRLLVQGIDKIIKKVEDTAK